MTAKTSKPKASAADTAFELPTPIREMAEKSLDQSREAFEKIKGAAEDATSAIEDQAQLAADTSSAVNGKAIDFAEKNIQSTFDLARKLMATKDLSEAVELQLSFARSQLETLGNQATELGELTQKAANDAAKPYKDQMEKTVADFKSVLPK